MEGHMKADRLWQDWGYWAKVKKDPPGLINVYQKPRRMKERTWKAAMGEFKGCAVGCLVRDLNGRIDPASGYDDIGGPHDGVSQLLGVPVELVCELDTLFERLPPRSAKTFPLRVLQAIPVGADLSGVMEEMRHMKHPMTVQHWAVQRARDLVKLLKEAPVC